jgi:hypothetical protein
MISGRRQYSGTSNTTGPYSYNMHTNLTWLTCSLFCSRDHWNHLLKAIDSFPYYRDVQDHGKPCLVEFNYLFGENIRLAFLMPEEECKHFALQTDTWFKSFFSKANFPVSKPVLPLKGIFLPFPQNTIQYGLYRPEVLYPPGQKYKHLLHSSLSHIIIEALKTEEIDDEMILTFTYYLHISLIKTILKGNLASVTEVYNCYNNSFPENEETAIITDNMKNMLAIADSIFNPQTREDIPGWLQQWISVCDMQMKMELTSANTFYAKYSRIVNQIHHQLGIEEKMGLLLPVFIRKTFEANILHELQTS